MDFRQQEYLLRLMGRGKTTPKTEEGLNLRTQLDLNSTCVRMPGAMRQSTPSHRSPRPSTRSDSFQAGRCLAAGQRRKATRCSQSPQWSFR